MTKVTVIIIDSRSKIHPDWVQAAIQSAQEQTVPVDVIVVENTERDKTIGRCWNAATEQAKTEWVYFLGDDNWMARDAIQVLLNHTDKPAVYLTTFMTMYDGQVMRSVPRQCTGMWKRDYILKHPFNEELQSGIDREYLEESKKRGDTGVIVPYYYGIYDRRHDDHRSTKIVLSAPKDKQDIYVTGTGSQNFVAPLVKNWRENDKSVFISMSEFLPEIKSDIIWCEWANENAVIVQDFETDARKFLRFHAYEAFSPNLFYLKWEKWEKVIFIADHIKDIVEKKVGKIPNAVVIPVGVDTSQFKVREGKNNKIAWAGQIARKKGAGELMLLANSFPEYEFHVAGKYIEDDVAIYFNEKKPDNMFIHPFSYDLKEWFKDYTYYLNTSMREGNPITVLEAMSSGLKPLVRDWVGADKIYEGYTYKNIDEFRKLLEDYHPKEYRKFAEQYDIKNTFKKVGEIISNL
jgi:hypothetical protein